MKPSDALVTYLKYAILPKKQKQKFPSSQKQNKTKTNYKNWLRDIQMLNFTKIKKTSKIF